MWRSPVNTKIGFLVYRILWSRVFQYAEKPCKHENQIFLFTGSCGVECFSPVEKPCKHENPIVLFTGSYGVECFSLQRNPVNTKIRFSCLQDLVGSSVKCFYRVSLQTETLDPTRSCKHENHIFLFTGSCGVECCRVFQSAEKPCKHEHLIFLFTGSCGVACFSLWRSPVNTKIGSCLHDLVAATLVETNAVNMINL